MSYAYIKKSEHYGSVHKTVTQNEHCRRRIGNLKGRTQRELADDHPIKQVYVTRLNTINRYIKRGTLDAELAKAMKKLAKDKMLRAISDVAYARGDYEKEMEQDALQREIEICGG